MEGETSKTYYFGQDNSLLSTLVPLLTQRGIDPSILYSMNGGFGGNNFIWLLFLLFFWGGNGWGGNGFGGGNSAAGFLSNQISNDAGRDLLLQAIQGNSTALGQLASTLGSDFNAVQSGITSMLSAIQSVGSQVGMSGLQTVNAIQAGDATLSAKLAECCCENRLLTTQQGYESRIATIEQTNTLGNAMASGNQKIVDAIADLKTTTVQEFCAARERDMQEKIDSLLLQNNTLRGQIDNANQTAQITSYVNSVVAPLMKEVTDIAAKQPNTVPVTWPNLTAVNNTPYGGGMYGFNPYGYGWGGTSYWG